jgi:membrane protease YdiL (CAAX protease family)
MSQDQKSSKGAWTFFALTFGLSWLFWVPAALWGQDYTSSAWLIPFMLGGFGPSTAGIIMVYRSSDEAQLRSFWRRLLEWRRISAGWYLLILLIFPASFATAFLLNVLLEGSKPELETLAQIAGNPLMLVGMIVLGIVTGPLSEELGWRGYALDQLQVRRSPLLSTLIVTPFWWAWHLPLFFIEGTTQHEWGFGTPSFWLFMAGIAPLSILLTWAYNSNKRSTLAAVLTHFTYNFTLGLAQPFSPMVYFWHVVAISIAALVVVLIDGARALRSTGATIRTGGG